MPCQSANVRVECGEYVGTGPLHTHFAAGGEGWEKSNQALYRERPTLYYAQVIYTDQEGKGHKVERQAENQKQAQATIKQIVRELAGRDEISVTSQRIRERRGGIFARVTYTDETGKRCEIERRANNRSHAKEMIKRLIRELDDYGGQSLEAAQMTFKELADYYEETYMIEAQYVDGRKVAGLRSLYYAKILLKAIREFFGNSKLRAIRHGDIERFKSSRLKTPTKHGKQRSIASVNRELSMLSRMFTVAAREDWILKNPFTSGNTLINSADERKRERILTRGEEEKLLAACAGPRIHLKPIIVCALDTGMRRGEIFKLKWSDVDFAEGVITIRAFNTKTMSERQVAMSERLSRELLALFAKSTQEPDSLCFGITNNVKTAFTSARRAAGLSDVRFHDLRHTHATRLATSHMPLSEVGRVLGHTQANTTYRYLNANVETARRAAALIDSFNRLDDDAEKPVIN